MLRWPSSRSNRWCHGWSHGISPASTNITAALFTNVARSLREAGFPSAIELLATYAGRPADFSEWLRGAAINRDRDLRLEYLAGMGMNLFESDRIYADMLTYRRFPEDLFVGSERRLQALWDAGGGGRAPDPHP